MTKRDINHHVIPKTLTMSADDDGPQGTVYKHASRIRSALKFRPTSGSNTKDYITRWDNILSNELVKAYSSNLCTALSIETSWKQRWQLGRRGAMMMPWSSQGSCPRR